MKHEKHTIKTVTILDYLTCDLCSSKIDEKEDSTINTIVENKIKLTHEIEIDNGYGDLEIKNLIVDICITCLNTKVLPFLRSIGLTREYKGWLDD